MSPLRPMLILTLFWFPTSTFALAAQDKAKVEAIKKFKKDVAADTTKLEAGEKTFVPRCGPRRAALMKVVNDWKNGFDPLFIYPKCREIMRAFKDDQATFRGVISTTQTARSYEDRAKKEGIYGSSEVVTVLRRYEQYRARLDKWSRLRFREAKVAHWDLKSPYAVLLDRAKRMAKDARAGISPSPESCPVIAVDKKGLMLWRVWCHNGDAGEWGPWWSAGQPPNTAKQARLACAAPPGNHCLKVTIIECSPGAKWAVGNSTSNFGHPDPRKKQYVFTARLKEHYKAWFNKAKIPARENPLATSPDDPPVPFIRKVVVSGRTLSD